MPNRSIIPSRNYLEATNDPRVVPPQMLVDFRGFFSGTKPGTVVSWAGGSLEHLDTKGASDGELEAIFTDTGGNQVSLTYWSNLCAKARENMSIAAEWRAGYNFDPDAPIHKN